MAIVASWPRNECQPVLAPMEAQEPDDIVVQETENKKRKATRDGRTDETKKRKKEKEEKKDKKDKKDKKEKKRKKKTETSDSSDGDDARKGPDAPSSSRATGRGRGRGTKKKNDTCEASECSDALDKGRKKQKAGPSARGRGRGRSFTNRAKEEKKKETEAELVKRVVQELRALEADGRNPNKQKEESRQRAITIKKESWTGIVGSIHCKARLSFCTARHECTWIYMHTFSVCCRVVIYECYAGWCLENWNWSELWYFVDCYWLRQYWHRLARKIWHDFNGKFQDIGLGMI